VTVATSIDGVHVVPLRRIDDDRGHVALMLKATDPHYAGFGEIYFSGVYPGVVKAWKLHRRMTANYACVRGRILVVLYDDRPGSPSHGAMMEVELDAETHYALVVIPPRVWHGFQGLGTPESLLANCASEPSDPDELERLDPAIGRIPYTWRELA
jgi:dTDP-4-dehydrorhamnose 3,5-epimerase